LRSVPAGRKIIGSKPRAEGVKVTRQGPGPWGKGEKREGSTKLLNLVGGLEHEFYDFPYIGNNHPN
jgi:hypothetical protein